MDQQIGQRLDAMNVTAELDEGDLVGDAVVILAVHEPGESEPRIVIGQSDGTSNLMSSALLHAASLISDEGWISED